MEIIKKTENTEPKDKISDENIKNESEEKKSNGGIEIKKISIEEYSENKKSDEVSKNKGVTYKFVEHKHD